MNLNRAIQIAVAAHDGQVDKAGAPYVLHPLRVMLSLESDDEKIVGVLHDVAEDCEGWSLERLQQEGFSDAVIDALRSVTKSPDDIDYYAFVHRAAQNRIGKKVKIADIQDNLDVKRLETIRDKDTDRLNKYLIALRLLQRS